MVVVVVDEVDVEVDVELLGGIEDSVVMATDESSGATGLSGTGWSSIRLSSPPSPDADTANAATATTANAASNVKRLSGTSAQCTSHLGEG